MQGGKKPDFVEKEINANRFFRDSHWLEIWKKPLMFLYGTEWRKRGYGVWIQTNEQQRHFNEYRGQLVAWGGSFQSNQLKTTFYSPSNNGMSSLSFSFGLTVTLSSFLRNKEASPKCRLLLSLPFFCPFYEHSLVRKGEIAWRKPKPPG
jgi:hypothetical protein